MQTRTPGKDTRKMPPLRLTAKGQPTGLIPHPTQDSCSLVDALYGQAVIGNALRLAITNGTTGARKTWHQLRRKVLRLEAQVARQGFTLGWGQPWPAFDGGLSVHAYIVDSDYRVVGSGNLSAFEWRKADHVMRDMMKKK